MIALVTNWSPRNAWTKRVSARQVIEGATLRARSLGDSLQVFWAREQGGTARRFSAVLRNRGIRGLIWRPS